VRASFFVVLASWSYVSRSNPQSFSIRDLFPLSRLSIHCVSGTSHAPREKILVQDRIPNEAKGSSLKTPARDSLSWTLGMSQQNRSINFDVPTDRFI